MSSPLLRTGLVVDLNNLFYGVQNKYGPKRRLAFTAYAQHLEGLGHTLVHKVAYTRQNREDIIGFATMLRNEGWEVHFGNTSWAIAMALRAAEMMDNIDAFVLGTNFEEAGRILKFARDRGKLTRCFAAGVPGFFKQIAECTEIPENLLEPPKAA